MHQYGGRSGQSNCWQRHPAHIALQDPVNPKRKGEDEDVCSLQKTMAVSELVQASCGNGIALNHISALSSLAMFLAIYKVINMRTIVCPIPVSNDEKPCRKHANSS
jgi:hypothetical protein